MANTAYLFGGRKQLDLKCQMLRCDPNGPIIPDGNMTNSGRWNITWDAENRAVSFASLPTSPLASQRKVDCAYDFQGRRVQKIVSTNNGAVWIPVSTNKFVHDGWNLAGIFDGNNNLLNSFAWGSDLSGVVQGAGGVGGLLSMTVYSGVNAGRYDYTYDGNGNVVAIMNAANGTIAGQWEYGPFGEVIRQTGPMAKANHLRFSTKYQDDESDLVYYGYRYYNAGTGRWANRDPLGLKAGLNTYQLLGNNSLNAIDLLGLVLCAFDGTGNNDATDQFNGPNGKGNAPSNVSIMKDLYTGMAFYENGVGTGENSPGKRGLGNVSGYGIERRLITMMNLLQTYLKDNPGEPVDIIGFSRGAASARIFANMLEKKSPCVKIRFLGLFDTVAQIGVPNDLNYQFGYDLSVNADLIGFTAQAVAENEYRSLFPLTSISSIYDQGFLSTLVFGPANYSPGEFLEISGDNYWEKPFAGAHSDIGGGYQDTRNLEALTWMISEGQAAGAPFKDLSTYANFKQLVDLSAPHDSRYPFIDWGSQRRVIFPGNL